MFSDTQFWRLVWKEYRVQRPLWLVMAIAPLLIQGAILLIAKLMSSRTYEKLDDAQVNLLMSVSYLASSVYLLGCCATIFSVEHETGTFDFQKMMPATQRQIFWSKVGFAAVSSLLLTVFLSLITRVGVLGLLIWLFFDTDTPGISVWFDTYGMLYLAELFVWSVLSLLLIRHPLWAVIVAISVQSSMMQLVIPYFVTGKYGLALTDSHDEFKRLVARWGVLLLTGVADVVIGKLWYEDRLRLPRWRFGLQPDMALSYPAAGELPPYLGQRQLGWSRLLWLGWRDARWIVGAVLLWYACCLKPTPTIDQWHALMLPYFLGSFVCGLFAFGSEQWGSRFRFATERGCAPRIVWLSRHVTWLPPVVLMTLGGTWLCWRNPQAFQSDIAYRQFEWCSVLIGPFVCYSAAQFAAMMCRSTVMALAVGLFLTILGIFWSIGMTSWLAPIWWSIGAWPVIGLFVTWLKANDWIEERRDRVARWRLALGLGIPICLLFVGLSVYRVVQIPVVTLPPEWDEAPQVLARLTSAEKATLDLYRRALTEIERGEDELETYGARKERLKHEHPDWTGNQIHSEAFTGFHRDWLPKHVETVLMLREAHRMPPVPVTLIEENMPPRPKNLYTERSAALTWLMIRHAEQSLASGLLDQTWEDIVVAFELQRRINLQAILPRGVIAPRMAFAHEDHLLPIVSNWGRHKEQTHDRVITAIRKLDELATVRETYLYEAHQQFLEAEEMLKFDERWREYAKLSEPLRQEGMHSEFVKAYWNSMFSFSERWRSQRVLRWLSSLAIDRADAMTRFIIAKQPLSPSLLKEARIGWRPEEMVMARTTILPPYVANGLSLGNQLLNRVTNFRANIVRLALADWHREHGRYPESLSELVPTYFAKVPCDPLTDAPFVFFSEGLPDDVTNGTEGKGNLHVLARKRVPFLWGAGSSRKFSVRLSPKGEWEFFEDDKHVLTPLEALSKTKIWLLEDVVDEAK